MKTYLENICESPNTVPGCKSHSLLFSFLPHMYCFLHVGFLPIHFNLPLLVTDPVLPNWKYIVWSVSDIGEMNYSINHVLTFLPVLTSELWQMLIEFVCLGKFSKGWRLFPVDVISHAKRNAVLVNSPN